MIKGSSILITGGAGFFGKAFARKALEHGAARVCIFSRDEMKHAAMEQEFKHHANLRFFLGDVRDRDRLRRAMEGIDLVIHAAALKRIQTGFYDPIEMVKTNVMGAVNVIEAALDLKTPKVIALSTDKAYQPISGYGHSKAMAESLFLAANNIRGEKGTKFSICRYGNIAGSTGSVIPIWRKMNDAGAEAVPVSHPDVTRFWMHIDQAVDLVMNMAETMQGGELVIPELPAYCLGDLVNAMGLMGYVTELGKFEKMHESMQDGMSSEHARRMTIGELREALKNV